MSKAFEESGCVKTFAGVEEHMYWNKDRDYLVSWSPAEHELVEDLKKMKFDLPPVLTDRDLGCAEGQEPKTPRHKSAQDQGTIMPA
jgi:hypothetical protein